MKGTTLHVFKAGRDWVVLKQGLKRRSPGKYPLQGVAEKAAKEVSNAVKIYVHREDGTVDRVVSRVWVIDVPL